MVMRQCPKLATVCSNVEARKENPGFKVVKIGAEKSGYAGGAGEKKLSQGGGEGDRQKALVFMAGPLSWHEVSYIERQGKWEYSFLAARMCTPMQYIQEIVKISPEKS